MVRSEIVRNLTSVPFVLTSIVRVCSDAPVHRSNVRGYFY